MLIDQAIAVAVRVSERRASKRSQEDPGLENLRLLASASLLSLLTPMATLSALSHSLEDPELEEYVSIAFAGLVLACLYVKSKVGPRCDGLETQKLRSMIKSFYVKAPGASSKMLRYLKS
jgi:hypothetical protein